MKKTALVASILFAAPLFALAATNSTNGIENLILSASRILNEVIPLLIALALVIFFWGLIQYIRSSGEGHGTGRNIMIAGLVTLFIMVSVWGIIRLLQNTLGINNTGITGSDIPQVPAN